MINSGWRTGHAKGVIEGRKEGIRACIETLQEVGVSKAEVCNKVCKKFMLSEEDARTCMGKYWKG